MSKRKRLRPCWYHPFIRVRKTGLGRQGQVMKETLYYDGQCSLCKREIARLREISDGLELCDIHAVVDADLPSRDTLLRELHLRDAQGEFVTGLDANVAAWQHTRIGWLWRVLQWPLVRPVASRCYDLWARRRYQRLYGGDR